MKRDVRKPEAYWLDAVQWNERSAEEFMALAADPAKPRHHRASLRFNVYQSRLHGLICRYSRGDALADLGAPFVATLQARHAYEIEPGREELDLEYLDEYVEVLWVLSFGYLLETDDDTWRLLLDHLAAQNVFGRDALIDRLVALRSPGRPVAGKVLFPDPYEPLVSALAAAPPQRDGLILRFLDRYYDGMEAGNVPWHDSHYGDKSGYFGYWCFELAALVKGLGWDDTAFARDVYYPRDLARG
jgi:hypothetical protein